MSGRIHGEVLDHLADFEAAGLSRNAVDALTVIAEGCRDLTRCGSVGRDRVAAKVRGAARTATRAITELVGSGLVVLISPGGGRGRAGVYATYQIVHIPGWVAELAGREDSAQIVVRGPGPDRSVGHQSEESYPQEADPWDTRMSPQSGLGSPDRWDKSGRLTGHLGVSLPVVPVTTPGEAPDVTTGPRATRPPEPPGPEAVPEAAARPVPTPVAPVAPVADSTPVSEPVCRDHHSAMNAPLSAPETVTGPRIPETRRPGGGDPHGPSTPPSATTGSRCGRPDCCHPRPCGDCGRARRTAQAQETAAAALAERLLGAEQRAAVADRRVVAEQRRAAAATCPNHCVDGYAGGLRVCDHRPRPDHRRFPGYQEFTQVRSMLAERSRKRAALAEQRTAA